MTTLSVENAIKGKSCVADVSSHKAVHEPHKSVCACNARSSIVLTNNTSGTVTDLVVLALGNLLCQLILPML